MTNCPECKMNNADVAVFCVNCGEELIPAHPEITSFASAVSASAPLKEEMGGASPLSDSPQSDEGSALSFPKAAGNASISEDDLFLDDLLSDGAADPPESVSHSLVAPFPDDLDTVAAALSPPQESISPATMDGIAAASQVKVPPVVQVTSIKITAAKMAASVVVLPFPDDGADSEEAASISPQGTGMSLTTIPAPVQWQDNECDMCGFQNEPEALYCGECGTGLAKKNDPFEAGIVLPLKIIQLSFDGAALVEFDLDGQGVAIDSASGDVSTPEQYQAESHALFRATGNEIVMTPPGSKNVIFVRIPSQKSVRVQSGSLLRIGNQILLLEMTDTPPDAWGVLRTVAPSPKQAVIPLRGEEIVVGRENGDVLFSDDPLISGTHMKIFIENGRCFVCDFGSTNGTFQQINEMYYPVPGQVFIIGPKIYKISASSRT